MYKEKIDTLIMEAMKSGNKVEASTYRMLKSEFLVFKTAKNAKPLDDNAEISIIKKMVNQRNEAAKEYLNGGRVELADKEMAEAEVLKKMLPAEITPEQINEAIAEVASRVEPVKKNMGVFMKELRTKYPSADGKLISQLVTNILN